jgi:hypothetical protein
MPRSGAFGVAVPAPLFATVVAGRARADGWDFQLPHGFPSPRVPADNPLTSAKVELGRYLFYDMHDGSIETLAAVLDHYAAGGRTIASGPYAGVGHDNPNKSPIVHGFVLTPSQRADLIAFLDTLTGRALLTDGRLANPWK